MMWRAVRGKVESRGGVVRLNADVVRAAASGRRDRRRRRLDGDGRGGHRGDRLHLQHAAGGADREARPARAAGRCWRRPSGSSYRDFLTVCLIVNQPELFPDNWIYIHDPGGPVGRIQNFKNWSPDMVPDPARSSLGLEYFCNEGDELWSEPTRDLIALGKREIERIGPGARRGRRGRLRRPRAEVLPGLRLRATATQLAVVRAVRGRPREPPDHRPQRPAPLQQPGPRDAHGHARRPQRGARRAERSLDRQRRPGVPRGGPRGDEARGLADATRKPSRGCSPSSTASLSALALGQRDRNRAVPGDAGGGARRPP